MPTVQFSSLGKFECESGTSILHTALDNDVELSHSCGGNCACSTCHVTVEEGWEHLSPMELPEEALLQAIASPTPRSRLSCQAKVFGDVSVRIPDTKDPYQS